MILNLFLVGYWRIKLVEFSKFVLCYSWGYLLVMDEFKLEKKRDRGGGG